MNNWIKIITLLLPFSLCAQTISIQHAMGTTHVPSRPSRVIVLETGALDTALSLDITPVGMVDTFSTGSFPAYLQQSLKEPLNSIANVGLMSQPSIEKIALLKPDLILSNIFWHKGIYEILSKIAPTILTGELPQGDKWLNNIRLYARALGGEEQIELSIKDYGEKANKLKKNLSQSYARLPTVSFLRFFSMGSAWIYREGSFIGSLFKDVGLSFPDVPAFRGQSFAAVDEESIPLLDADYVFFSLWTGSVRLPHTSEELYKRFFRNPLWSRTKSFQEGHILQVNDDHWMMGMGIQAALSILDDLENILLKKRFYSSKVELKGLYLTNK